jgi:hypothetical protein
LHLLWAFGTILGPGICAVGLFTVLLPIKRIGMTRKRGLRVLLVGIVLAFTCGGLLSASMSPEERARLDTQTRESAMAKEMREAAAKQKISAQRPKVGDYVSVGYWEYRCKGMKWEYNGFLKVYLTVHNNDESASFVPPIQLVDEAGRVYSEDGTDRLLLTTLNPGISREGYAIFEAPPGKYVLRVSGGFESGKTELISLTPGFDLLVPSN